MLQQKIGLLIGGVIPAFIFGIYGILQKTATKQGISPGMLLIIMGGNIIIVGFLYCFIFKEFTISMSSVFFASLTGICWGIGTVLVTIALSKYKMPISKLAPIFNMNTLVTVILGLLIFAESKDINVPKILVASVFIVIGGTLATNS
jgi:drug/metabolite transporter (DMT)-like permease